MATAGGPAAPAMESVDPAQAQGAQIPLLDFNVPIFPPEARNLQALTLTSDIKVDEYQRTLSQPFFIPPLPPAIESLTLELFSLGFPPGFLAELATRLPNLKSVVIYSQLFAGITPDSTADAVEFFKRLPNLRALHLLDVFAKPGFFSAAAKWLKYNTSDVPGEARRGLMFLEVNYTFRHEDQEFMEKICATELTEMIGPGLISCNLNISPPEPVEDDDDSGDQKKSQEAGSNIKEGVMAFTKDVSTSLVARLTDDETSPKGLRGLNTTLFTLSLTDLKRVLSVQRHIMMANICVEMEPGEDSKKELVTALQQCTHLEQVEVVCNPTLQFFMSVQDPKHETLAKTFPSESDMSALANPCEKLSSFKANVLRATTLGSVEWEKKNGSWSGGVK